MDKILARKRELVQIIEAIGEVEKNKDWQMVKELVFDPLIERLERDLLAEAKTEALNVPKILRLQGQLTNAKRYDLRALYDKFRNELQGLELRKNNNDNITEGFETN